MNRLRGESKIQNLKSKISMAVLAVAIFVADQVTKVLVERRVAPRGVVPVIAGFFNLTNTKNSGAVFGIFADSTVWWKIPLLVVISIVLLVVVVWLVAKTRNLHWATALGLALVLGGALSNLFDRMRSGMVEDFLDFYFRNYHWYTFNLADSAVVVGTGFIVLQVLFGE